MEELEFSRLDIPVSLSVWPGGVEARTMTAISGRKYLGLLTNSGRIGLCVKTLLGTSQWGSTLCFLTWKVRATPAGRLLFQLAPRMPRTGETGSGLLPTMEGHERNVYPRWSKTRKGVQSFEPNLAGIAMLLPTPRANDAEKRGNIDPTNPRNGLPGFAKMLPTPMTTDAKNNGGPGMMKRNTPQLNAAVMLATPQSRDFKHGGAHRWENPKKTRNLNDQMGGKLNADFVEAMMGFPVGWTLLESGKPRPSHTKRGKKLEQARE